MRALAWGLTAVGCSTRVAPRAALAIAHTQGSARRCPMVPRYVKAEAVLCSVRTQVD